jgi:hypothetical protein
LGRELTIERVKTRNTSSATTTHRDWKVSVENGSEGTDEEIMNKTERKKFCEELIACFPIMRYGREEKTRNLGYKQIAASSHKTTFVFFFSK